MKIAFTGAHGVGKTTLINSLEKNLSQSISLNVTKEIPRIICDLVSNPEYFRRDQNTLVKQMIILLGQLTQEYELSNSKLLICDRTIFDHWAYTLYLFQKELNNDHILACEKFQYAHMKTYDKIFYIPIEFEVEDDGTREDDKVFQEEIDRLILKNLTKHDLPYIEINGSVEERYQMVINNLEL